MSGLPEVGDKVRIMGDHSPEENVYTVTDMLSTQFTATREVQRADGGWCERTAFMFYNDRGETWEMLD